MAFRSRLDRLRRRSERWPVAVPVEQMSDEELLRLIGPLEASDQHMEAILAASCQERAFDEGLVNLRKHGNKPLPSPWVSR